MATPVSTPGSANTAPFQPLSCTPGKSMAFTLNFGGTDEYSVNFNYSIESGVIDMIQSIYFDNREALNDVVFEWGGSDQTIITPAARQGYLPVITTEKPIVTIRSLAAIGSIARFIVCNFRTQPYIW